MSNIQLWCFIGMNLSLLMMVHDLYGKVDKLEKDDNE